MPEEKTISVIDEPGNSYDPTDPLGINSHAEALKEFIVKTGTPLTIGIQGEWGSGKTTLLNIIKSQLNEEVTIKQIWVNAWENSLLSTPEESLIKIISEIITEMVGADAKKETGEKLKAAAGFVFRGAMRIGASAALGSVGTGIADEVIGGSNSGNGNPVKELRKNLVDLVQEIRQRETNKYDKIVIYIDDLDRMLPSDAVRVLELLKNIFSVPGCVFVLAIDYQVVVKGLESKFGKMDGKNEWEYRAFFDKIIQLPYMMPISQYSIGKYVRNLLDEIDYKIDPEHEGLIERVVKHTIGGNPRSIKRLINSVSLIKLFCSKSDSDPPELLHEDVENLLLFTLVCIQISYPDVFNHLLENPNFVQWSPDQTKCSNDFHQHQISNRMTLGEYELQYEKDFNLACQTESFDEEWEKYLYKFCYPKERYRRRVTDISDILSIIRDEIVDADERLEIFVAYALDSSSVTSVTASDTGPSIAKKPWMSEEDQDRRKDLWALLKSQWPETTFLTAPEPRVSNMLRKITPKSKNCQFVITIGCDFQIRILNGSGNKLFQLLFDNKQEFERKLLEKLPPKNGDDDLYVEFLKRDSYDNKKHQMSLKGKHLEFLQNKIVETRIKGCPSEELWDEITETICHIVPAFETTSLEVLDTIPEEIRNSMTELLPNEEMVIG